METVVHRIGWIATALACAVLITGCYSTPTYTPATVPSGAVAVPIRLLGERGILEQPPPYVIAATSIGSLEALVDNQYCHKDECRGTEWDAIPGVGGDLLLALPDTAGYEIKSVAAWRGIGDLIMIAEGLVKTCSGGACTAPFQAMYLAVVPRVALPDGIVTFQVAGEPSGSTVDLRITATTPSG